MYVCVQVIQSCPTLCSPKDRSAPGFSFHGISQARILEKWKVKVTLLSHVLLFVTPWTVAYQAPNMGFSRQEYWSGLSFPSPGDLPDPGIEPKSPALQTDALPSEPPGSRWLFPTPRDLPNPGIEPALCLPFLLHWQAGSLPPVPPGKPNLLLYYILCLFLIGLNSVKSFLVVWAGLEHPS